MRVVEDSGKEVLSVNSKMSVAMTATMCSSLMILYIQIRIVVCHRAIMKLRAKCECV